MYAAALKSGWINEVQAHAIEFKRPMLNPAAFVWVSLLCFAIWGFYTWRLNDLGLKRDAASPATTPEWIKRLENISGPGIVIYAITMTAAVIYWVMSLDPTWYSSVYGLLFLVGQAYGVLALSIIVVVSLSQGRAVQDDSAPDRAARSGQVHLCLCDAEYLSGLLAVPHHLVGKSAGRNSLVP